MAVPTLRELIRQRELIAARKRQRMTVADDDYGTLLVARKRRRVRITAIVKTSSHNGKATGASYAFVDLDEQGVDKLIHRLQAIRGGRKALP